MDNVVGMQILDSFEALYDQSHFSRCSGLWLAKNCENIWRYVSPGRPTLFPVLLANALPKFLRAVNTTKSRNSCYN